MRTALVALAAAALCGCGHTATAERPAATFSARGVTVELPPGWQPAAERLTPQLLDPREVLSVGTYPLRYRRMGCNHMPSSALADLGPRDAFVTLQERGRDTPAAGFPPRPERFETTAGGGSDAVECVPGSGIEDHWLTFSDAGRRFHVLVVFGPDAPAAVRAQAWSILDGMGIDAAVRPHWDSSA